MCSRVLQTLALAMLLLAMLSPEGAEAGIGMPRRSALRARARQEAADRLRRGFQNSALATARGFGKRGDPNMLATVGDRQEPGEGAAPEGEGMLMSSSSSSSSHGVAGAGRPGGMQEEYSNQMPPLVVGGVIPLEEASPMTKLIEASRSQNNQHNNHSFNYNRNRGVEMLLPWGARVRENKRSSAALSQHDTDEERYPVSMVSELVSSSPALAMSLVARFLDTDEDGYVTPKELLAMM